MVCVHVVIVHVQFSDSARALRRHVCQRHVFVVLIVVNWRDTARAGE